MVIKGQKEYKDITDEEEINDIRLKNLKGNVQIYPNKAKNCKKLQKIGNKGPKRVQGHHRRRRNQ